MIMVICGYLGDEMRWKRGLRVLKFININETEKVNGEKGPIYRQIYLLGYQVIVLSGNEYFVEKQFFFFV